MQNFFVNLTCIKLTKLNTCLIRTQKFVPRRFTLDRFNCTMLILSLTVPFISYNVISIILILPLTVPLSYNVITIILILPLTVPLCYNVISVILILPLTVPLSYNVITIILILPMTVPLCYNVISVILILPLTVPFCLFLYASAILPILIFLTLS